MNCPGVGTETPTCLSIPKGDEVGGTTELVMVRLLKVNETVIEPVIGMGLGALSW